MSELNHIAELEKRLVECRAEIKVMRLCKAEMELYQRGLEQALRVCALERDQARDRLYHYQRRQMAKTA